MPLIKPSTRAAFREAKNKIKNLFKRKKRKNKGKGKGRRPAFQRP